MVLLLFLVLPNFLTNFWWFESLGFSKIFTINIEAFLLVFFVSAFLFFVFSMANLWFSKGKGNFFPTRMKVLVTLVAAFLVGRIISMEWLTVMKFLRQSPFGMEDPVFMKDISFYVFTLPFLEVVWNFAFITLTLTTILVIFDYFQNFIVNAFRGGVHSESVDKLSQDFNIKKEFRKLKKRTIVHIAALVSLFFLLFSFKHYLSRFSVLFSERGSVFGAGYADIYATLPVLNILVLMAFGIALASFLVIGSRRKVLFYLIGIYLIFLVLGLGLFPQALQSLRVVPNEFNLEEPYIQRNIDFTKEAYGLDVDEQFMDFDRGITEEMIERNPGTINNIRLLDWRPLKETYRQTQEIRLYYDLSSIDIDRYNIDGDYTQVMLSAREMDQRQLRDRARTWVNQHLVYTHGYGAVMSPTRNVTSEGLPVYLVKDVPPRYTVDEENIKIDRPEIYYGENENRYVIVNTKTEEFNYPKGDENVYTNYEGDGGVQLDSFFKKFFMSLRFMDIKLLMTSDIVEDSRIMYTRSVQDRIKKVTPFLQLDSDPYLVIADGKLYWMQDAYTTTNKFPYSESMGGINYVRNSVKIVVDAYSGDLDYYIMSDDDPIMETYSNIYPGQFKRFDDMPDSLKEHIRYPVDIFNIQSQLYKTYHMDSARVFYNKEDEWELPLEIYGTGQSVKVEPYYVILTLPGGDEEEFILMSTFTPKNRNNMASWLGARSDGENYGELVLYRFPKDRIAYGPSQIEAMIDQNTEISQQLTLWSRMGSTVIRGNLLVIPIDNSILYVEPLYLQAEQSSLPQLKRVIVSDGDRVVMAENLDLALKHLFIEDEIPVISPEDNGRTALELVEEANMFYNEILISMENKNWSGIGSNLDNLGNVLERLN